MSWRILEGDCIEVMAAMAEASVDALVTDPPYGLEFMGKEWDRLGATTEAFREQVDNAGRVDYHGKGNAPFGGGGQRVRYGASAASMQAWHEAWAREALRVLKPGGHLLAFGGTRTYHRLTCAIEDAGFEVRDCIAWMYGSGFPKSLDVSKAIDKAAGAEREVVGPSRSNGRAMQPGQSTFVGHPDPRYGDAPPQTAPATEEAARWQGWGTALKPAFEPIVVARKPLAGTVAGNVLAHGTGALNVDGCRIEGSEKAGGSGTPPLQFGGRNARPFHEGATPRGADFDTTQGRWPANVVLDEEAATILDEQTGHLHAAGNTSPSPRRDYNASSYKPGVGTTRPPDTNGDSGGASRFYYCAKAASGERNAGLGGEPSLFDLIPCTCETDTQWVNEDQRAVTPPDSDTPPPRATTAPTSEDGCDSSTSGSGSRPTDPSPTDSTSTTSTRTSKTTTLPTSNSSTPSPTSDTTAPTTDAQTAANGSDAAPSAASGNQPPPSTTTSTAKAGSSTADADPATFGSSSQPSRSAGQTCASCGGVIGGARRNEHPT